MTEVVVVIPNLNGKADLKACLDSVHAQSVSAKIVVVDNASKDGSVKFIKKHYPTVELLINDRNEGYTGGVNPGMQQAIDENVTYVVPFNNDAVADKDWLKHLKHYLDTHPKYGIAASKVLDARGTHIDSTGDQFTVWGLPYPRGRGETDVNKYDDDTEIFAASGAASMYRVAMLKEIGLLDQDFFAYYEDVDISFRAQLAGWKVAFVPEAVVYHNTGATSSKIKGFTTYQTMKNQPLLLYKNVPRKYLWRIGWRFTIAHVLFFLKAFTRKQGWAAFTGDMKGTELLFAARRQRKIIQREKKVSDEYIWNIITHDLPPNAYALRKLRNRWRKMTFRKAI